MLESPKSFLWSCSSPFSWPGDEMFGKSHHVPSSFTLVAPPVQLAKLYSTSNKITHPNTVPIQVGLTFKLLWNITKLTIISFPEKKIILNSITFVLLVTKIVKWQMTTPKTTSSRAFRWYVHTCICLSFLKNWSKWFTSSKLLAELEDEIPNQTHLN